MRFFPGNVFNQLQASLIHLPWGIPRRMLK